MALKDEVDDSMYVQQQWENNNFFNEHEIQEILSQFSVNQELRNLQLNFFGMSEPIVDPQLQLPGNNDFFQMAAQPVGKDPLLGKRNFKEPESSIQTPKNTIQPLPTPITNKRQKITEKTTKFTKEIQNDIPMKEGKQTRECHNMNERQRRLKINQKIQDLKELLPKSCADILTNKLAILHESVDHIQNLHRVVEHLNERNLYLEQRLIEQEKDLLLLKQFNNNNNNNNSINNNSNNANNNKNNDNNDNNDNSNNNSINPSALSNLLATSSIQYQRQLPSNSVINYNLLSPISALFNR